MSKPRAPTPPDPAQTAAAQTQSNQQTAISNAWLNNVNQNTPWGQISYDQSGSGPDGTPRFTQTTTLSPNQQQINNIGEQNSIGLGNLAQTGINTAGGVLGQDWNQRYFDGNGATGGPLDLASALGDFRGDTEARTRELLTRGLDDQFNRSEESLRSRLANQGVNAGSDAFGSEMQSFNAGKGDAYANAEVIARQQALGERNQQMGEITNQRGINWNEALQQYGLNDQADFNARARPLNEITSLNSGSQLYYQPTTPGQPNSYNINGTDVAGIYNQGYQNQLGAYNARVNQQNGLLSGMAQLGAAAITASDVRVKRDIEFSHTDEKGHNWWTYRYLWDGDDTPLRTGVMAQEVREIAPHAVIQHTSGYLMVAYGLL